MGLESHIKQVLKEDRETRYMYFVLYYSRGHLRLRAQHTSERNEIYNALERTKEFCPKKLGKCVIMFKPMSDCSRSIWSK